MERAREREQERRRERECVRNDSTTKIKIASICPLLSHTKDDFFFFFLALYEMCTQSQLIA